MKPIGCVHKFHHIAEQNVIGSARIACLCFTPRSHAAESLPGFIVDNHKIFLVVVERRGGGEGAEGLGWDLPEV